MRTVLIRFVGLEIPLSSIMCSFRPNVVGASPLVDCNFFSFSIHALASQPRSASVGHGTRLGIADPARIRR